MYRLMHQPDLQLCQVTGEYYMLNCMRIILLYYGRVRETYRLMHTNQTYDFVKGRVSSM